MVLDLSLPNGAQQFAAEPLRSGLPIAHDSPTGADDGDAQTVEHRLELVAAAVQPASRPAGAVDLANDALSLRSVFQINPQDGLRSAGIGLRLEDRMAVFPGSHLAYLVVQDEPFLLEHLNDALLHARGGHVHRRPLDPVRIAYLGQEISYRIRHHVAALQLITRYLPTRLSDTGNQA